jgi:hypothetical protein
LVEVSLAGVELYVPRSAYADLANPTSMSLTLTQGGVVVMISGGTDGSPYTCSIEFVEDQIVKRRVEDRSFPNNYYEITTYINVILDN